MKKYRKKPVVVEAKQFHTLDDYMEICEWIREWGGDPVALIAFSTPDMFINTLEGRMEATPGDWIIRGVAGEYYPCKPEIFDATYEVVA